MDFFINLLFSRGKLITRRAAETINQALKKCLQIKRKISTDYKNSTQMIAPFENIMDVINYTARKYTSDNNNYVITSDLRYLLYEHLSKAKNQEEIKQQTTEETNLEELYNENWNAVAEWLNSDQRKIKNGLQHKDSEKIVDNLNAILKSEELLLKNIFKLINLLEKKKHIRSNPQLEELKRRLRACTDILANKTQEKSSNLINKLVEEEITRCRFTHDESKRSAQIDLNIQRPEGIQDALDTSHKKHDVKEIAKHIVDKFQSKPENIITQIINLEVRKSSLKRAKSEPSLGNRNLETMWTETQINIEETRKLIHVNEEHFNKFENTLWHTTTTLKYISLRSDHINLCKCAFYNKRQFMATEAALLKKTITEDQNFGKFAKISSSVFRTLERRLLAESGQEETKILERQKQEMQIIKDIFSSEQKRREEIEVMKRIFPREVLKSVKMISPNDDNRLEIRTLKNIFPGERDRQETKVLKKIFPSKKDKHEMKTETVPQVLIQNDKNEASDKKGKDKVSENSIEEATNRYFIQTLRNSDLRNTKKAVLKPVKMRLNISLKNQGHTKTTLKNPQKIDSTRPETPRTVQKKLSMNDAQLLYVNKKAFDQLEKTIRSVHLVDKNSPKTTISRKNMKKATCKKKSNSGSRGAGDEKRDLHTDVKKCKTFLKKSKSLQTTRKASFIKVPHSAPNMQMRRTTKNAIKREQYVTLLPKVTKDTTEKTKPQIRLVEIDEIKCAKRKQKKEVSGCETTSFVNLSRKFSDKILKNSFVSKFVKKSPKESHCGNEEKQDSKVETTLED